MIEQAMYFALGVLVAGLLGLMILPALWRRAVRLSTRRLEMLTPLSMEEVLAERDLLRAEFAVEGRRLEERLMQERERHSVTRGALGRETVALAKRTDEAEALANELARAEREAAQARAQAVDLQAQLGAALKEIWDASAARDESHAAQDEAQKQKRLAGERQVVIAGLEARLATLEMRERDLARDLGERDKLLAGRHALIERLTDERDRARAELQGYSDKQASLRATLEARDRSLSELDEARAELERKAAGLERDLRQARRGATLSDEAERPLRQSIAELGADVIRIAEAVEGAPPAKPAPRKPAKGRRAAAKAAPEKRATMD